MIVDIDIKENDILRESKELLDILLFDHTTEGNIIWATDMYGGLGDGYGFHDPILPELITNENGVVIRPRAAKSREEQEKRSRDNAEVFTPAWICNAQNNLIDNAWFGREGVFNTEGCDEKGNHSWVCSTEPITFPDGRNWEDYVKDTRLEVSCGEAPYLASRYDTTTGEFIPIERRIGLLDRKLRVVSENTDNVSDWNKAAQVAFKSTYGFEWQGDNLLIARETLLYTYVDFFLAKFEKKPTLAQLKAVAGIIAWNVWQMDGLKGVVPDSCREIVREEFDLFGESTKTVIRCEGCQKDDIYRHNGRYCLIKDWKEGKTTRFVDLLKK